MTHKSDIILQYIKKYQSSVKGPKGITTAIIAEALKMQRSNVSSILNRLVDEGVLDKVIGRPVIYSLNQMYDEKAIESTCFKELTGSDGSLKNQIHLAKAAILYPDRNMHISIVGQKGVGISYFIKLIHRFAIESRVLNESGKLVIVDCRTSRSRPDLFESMLFEGEESQLRKADQGILVLSHVDALDPGIREKIFQVFENGLHTDNGLYHPDETFLIGTSILQPGSSGRDPQLRDFTVTIELPPLTQRKMKERFQLIEGFLSREVGKSTKSLRINREIMMSLLLYRCDGNVKQLKKDVQLACASAYARDYMDDGEELVIKLSDFPYYVSEGLTRLAEAKDEVLEIVGHTKQFVYEKDARSSIKRMESSIDTKRSIYHWIDEKADSLRKHGVKDDDLQLVLSIEMENEIKNYELNLSETVDDKRQLNEIVDKRIIDVLEALVDEATSRFSKVYPTSLFFGMCLHTQAAFKRGKERYGANISSLGQVAKQYPSEYALCSKYVKRLEEVMGALLPIDEAALLAMFLTKAESVKERKSYPVVLVAMHGDSAAKSIVDVSNFMSEYPSYSYDMPLNKTVNEAYHELKEMIINIHRDKGVFVIYDMGSFKHVFDRISRETRIEIKTLQIPVVLLTLDLARKSMMGMDLGDMHRDIKETSSRYLLDLEPDFDNQKKVVLTLCLTGEGTAVQLKEMIEEQFLNDVKVMNLPLKDPEVLTHQVNQLMKDYRVVCAVGSYDPGLIGIPFVPITDIINNQSRALTAHVQNTELTSQVTETEPGETALEKNIEAIFTHLNDSLENIDLRKMKKILPEAFEAFQEETGHRLQDEPLLAIMIHIACFADKYCAGMVETAGDKPDFTLYNQDAVLKEKLQPVEEAYSVVFQSSEIKNIMFLIQKSLGNQN